MVKNKKNNVRVRFSPSPTGHLHIGGLRVAIFNWLFARHNGGKYLVRIEDTDRERSTQEYTDSILAALDWCALDHDEEPVLQSDRSAEHKKIVQQLLDTGKAYRCYCTPEEIIERQKAKVGYNDLFSMYDGTCRDKQEEQDKPFVVRFKVPREEKTITFDDLVRGTISFDVDQFDDFIISRSDGSPMYNLVVVIDDEFMKISHVIRGEDHISNTPKQIMLSRACGFSIPQFAHLPMILGPSGDRLSKRDAATSVLDYRTNGYLPDALVNYLVRLGWSHGDQEIFTRDEMIKLFTLDHVGKKGAIFDPAKLDWLNSVYLRELSAIKILKQIQNNVDPEFLSKLKRWNQEQVLLLLDLYKDRVKTLGELIEQIMLLHDGPTEFDQQAMEKWIKTETKEYLAQLIERLSVIEPFTESNIADCIKGLVDELGIKLVALAQPIRIALTGTSASPGIFILLGLIGKQETHHRLTLLLDRLS